MWTFDYTAHRAFVAPAAEKSQIWRLIVGMILIVGVFIGLGSLIYTLILQALTSLSVGIDVANVLSLLFSFGAASVGVFATVYFVHNCQPGVIFGPIRATLAHFYLVALAMTALLVALAVLPPWGFDEPLIANRAFWPWLLVLPIALISVLIQTSAEEILFRGYLQQHLGARFSSPWIWKVLVKTHGLSWHGPPFLGLRWLILRRVLVIWGLLWLFIL
jgi:membrane protease YdiL (CAAX protease family)